MSAKSTPGRGAHMALVGGGVLAALIVVATALFVVGVSIERGNEPSHHVESGEAAHETGEEPHSEAPPAAESDEELRPLDIDEAGLAVLAGVVAALHLAAGAVAARMALEEPLTTRSVG